MPEAFLRACPEPAWWQSQAGGKWAKGGAWPYGKREGERKSECWVLLTSLCSGYKLGGAGGGVAIYILLPISKCDFYLNFSFHLMAKQQLWNNSVYQSTQGLPSWGWFKVPQHQCEGGFHQVPHLPLRSPRLHGALLDVYSDLSLSLSPPCGPSRLSGCLLTTPRSAGKAVCLCPDTPNDLPPSVVYTQGVTVPSGVEMDMTSPVSLLPQSPDGELSHISPL